MSDHALKLAPLRIRHRDVRLRACHLPTQRTDS